MSQLGVNLALTAVVAVAMLTATFVVAHRRRRYDLVDSVWGLGFAVLAVVTFALSAGEGPLLRRAVATLLTVAWGLRLSAHIHTRNRARPEDQRYVEILGRGGANPAAYMYTRVYLLQAAIMWVVSLPVQVAQYGAGGPWWLLWIGVAVWAIGFALETIGDAQLRAFRAGPANASKVLDTGLWRYTRHPNYFGDATVWWGLYLLACHSWLGVATIVSPIAMTALLAKGTGKPLLERDIATRRPEYARYVASTSGFFPLPPKREPLKRGRLQRGTEPPRD